MRCLWLLVVTSLDIGKKLFPLRVVRHWHWFPRETMAAPYLRNVPGEVGWGLQQFGLVDGGMAVEVE